MELTFWPALFDDTSDGLENSVFLSKVLDLAEGFIFHWNILQHVYLFSDQSDFGRLLDRDEKFLYRSEFVPLSYK